mgnify:FL=1
MSLFVQSKALYKENREFAEFLDWPIPMLINRHATAEGGNITVRRNFAQVLRAGKVDPQKEYSKLYSLFYNKDSRDGKSLADLISMNFKGFDFRGTCLTLDEFDEEHGFNFAEQPQDFDIDYLVSFCEYIYNLLLYLEDNFFFEQFNKCFYLQQIDKVVDAIGYMQSFEDGFAIFLPKDNTAIVVSESEYIPENLSYKVIAYNHHSMKGNLEQKKQTLLIFADLLEPKRNDLESVDRQFTSDLFYAFNNFNIRHNNVDSTGKKYKKPIADLKKAQLEQWYDEIYQMCLLAFMRLEHIDRKKKFDVLKTQIEG